VRSATEREVAPSVPCAHDVCTDPAIIRQKLASGWANLCRHHHDFHHLRQAQAFCKAKGLETVAQKQAWIKERAGSLGKMIVREPGSDDE